MLALLVGTMIVFAVLTVSAASPLTLKPSSPLTRREGRTRSDDVAAEVSGIANFALVKHGEAHPRASSLMSLGITQSVGLLPASLPLNGNFEDGDVGAIPPYWGQTPSLPAFISTDEAHNGTKSLKLDVDHELVSGWDADSCFEVESGTRYLMTFWAKTAVPNAGLVTMFPVYSNFENTAFRRALLTTDNAFQMYHTIPVTTEWQKYSHEFTADEDSSKVRLLIGCTGGPIFIDDIGFQQECSDMINIYGAEGTQPSAMGTFTRLKHKTALPVYKNTHGMYLYFWAVFDSWLIGSDYLSETAVLQSPNSVDQDCPIKISGSTWSVYRDDGNGNYKWLSMPLTLEKVGR